MIFAILLAAIPPPPPTQPMQRVTICQADGGGCQGMGSSSGALTDTQLRASPVPVSGSLAVGDGGYTTVYVVGFPGDGGFGTTYIAGTPAVTVSSGTLTCNAGTGTLAVSGPVTDAQLRASAVPVSLASVPTHGVTGTFWQATQPVSGTFWQATQPVSGTFWQTTQPVSIASMPSTPVTGTFWQATQPVSGTVAATQSGTWGARVTGNAGANLDGPTGSAPPANALLQGLRETTNMVAQVQCDKTAMANIATATDTQLVALSGSTIIYVCSAYIEIQGIATTAGTLQLEYGTGTNCGTGKTAITPTFIGSTTAGSPTVVPMSAGAGYLFKTTAGQALCALSATTTVQKVFVTYAQF